MVKLSLFICGLEDRGIMFVEQVFEFMRMLLVKYRENDLAVIRKRKKLTNTRTSSKDHTVVLK
jgi:predicted membrane GTPase involved in stress response